MRITVKSIVWTSVRYSYSGICINILNRTECVKLNCIIVSILFVFWC